MQFILYNTIHIVSSISNANIQILYSILRIKTVWRSSNARQAYESRSLKVKWSVVWRSPLLGSCPMRCVEGEEAAAGPCACHISCCTRAFERAIGSYRVTWPDRTTRPATGTHSMVIVRCSLRTRSGLWRKSRSEAKQRAHSSFAW